MIWAGATVVVLVAALAAFLSTRRRFSTGNVLSSSVLSAVALAPIALAGGALSLLPDPSFGTYLAVLPFGIAYVFWLDLTLGVSARLARIGPRGAEASAGRPARRGPRLAASDRSPPPAGPAAPDE
jgi:hypothetical protein